MSNYLYKSESKISWIKNLYLYILSFAAIISVFGFAPFNQPYLTLIALVAFVKIFTIDVSLRKRYSHILLWFVVFNYVSLLWLEHSIVHFGGFPKIFAYISLVGVAGIIAVLQSSIFWLWVLLRRKLWTLPFLWILSTSITSWILNFSWAEVGYIDLTFIGKILAPTFGIKGTSFAYVSFAVIIIAILQYFNVKTFNMSKNRTHVDMFFAAIFLFAISCFAIFKPDYVKPNGNSYKAALLQGNINSHEKWNKDKLLQNIKIYNELFLSSVAKADVIIFPESAIGSDAYNLQNIYKNWQRQAKEHNTDLIIGTIYKEGNATYNSAMLYAANATYNNLQEIPRFDKQNLVPFGEFLPAAGILKHLGAFFKTLSSYNFKTGADIQEIFVDSAKRKFSLNICYDISFANIIRQNVESNSAIVTISNDVWFGTTYGPWQHLAIAQARALENGVPVLRATNNGWTAYIDYKGRVIHKIPQNKAQSLIVDVQNTTGQTWYNKYGQWFLYLTLLLSFLAMLVLSLFIENKNKFNYKKY